MVLGRSLFQYLRTDSAGKFVIRNEKLRPSLLLGETDTSKKAS